MTPQEYEKAQDAVFERMDRHRPSTKPALSLSAFQKAQKVAWFTGVKYSISAGIGGALLIPHTSDATGLMVGLGVTIGLIGGALAFQPEGRKIGALSLNERLTQAVIGLWGGSGPLDRLRAHKIAVVAEKYPRLRDTAIGWAANSTENILSLREGAVLLQAAGALDKVQDRFESAAKLRQETRDISEVLNQHGLLDRAMSQASANALVVSTPQSAGWRRNSRM